VKIKSELLPWQDGQKKLYVAAASGVYQPDIFYQPATYMNRLANGGHVEEVDRYLTKEDTDDTFPAVLKRNRYKGKLYFFPWLTYTSLVFVNRAIFKEKGAENLLPTNENRTWTLDEFSRAAQAVTFKRGDADVYGFGTFFGNPAHWFQPLWGMGARVFNDEGTKIVMSDPGNRDTIVRGLQWYLDLQDATKSLLPGLAAGQWPPVQDAFYQGRLAMAPMQIPSYQGVRNAQAQGKVTAGGFDLYGVSVPADKGQDPHPYIEDGGWTIFKQKDGAKLDALMGFGRWLGNTENQRAIEANTTLPCRKSAMSGMYADDRFMQFAINTAQWNTPDLMLPSNVIGGFFGLLTELDAMGQAVLSGQRAPAAALQEGTKRCDDALKALLAQGLPTQ
jgi:ABC-type glycerol-3-phosphate transport system substrate-binding protein